MARTIWWVNPAFGVPLLGDVFDRDVRGGERVDKVLFGFSGVSCGPGRNHSSVVGGHMSAVKHVP